MSDVRSAVSFFLFPAVYFLFKRIKKMAVEKKERMLEHRKSDIPFICWRYFSWTCFLWFIAAWRPRQVHEKMCASGYARWILSKPPGFPSSFSNPFSFVGNVGLEKDSRRLRKSQRFACWEFCLAEPVLGLSPRVQFSYSISYPRGRKLKERPRTVRLRRIPARNYLTQHSSLHHSPLSNRNPSIKERGQWWRGRMLRSGILSLGFSSNLQPHHMGLALFSIYHSFSFKRKKRKRVKEKQGRPMMLVGLRRTNYYWWKEERKIRLDSWGRDSCQPDPFF